MYKKETFNILKIILTYSILISFMFFSTILFFFSNYFFSILYLISNYFNYSLFFYINRENFLANYFSLFGSNNICYLLKYSNFGLIFLCIICIVLIPLYSTKIKKKNFLLLIFLSSFLLSIIFSLKYANNAAYYTYLGVYNQQKEYFSRAIEINPFLA